MFQHEITFQQLKDLMNGLSYIQAMPEENREMLFKAIEGYGTLAFKEGKLEGINSTIENALYGIKRS